jgi:hypothetical protein
MRRTVLIVIAALISACGRDDRADKEKSIIVGITSDIQGALTEMQDRHEVDIQGAPPEGWLTDQYLAAVRSRPDIERYFRNYLAYTGELETRYDAVTDSIIDARFRQAGFDASSEAKFKAAFKRGFDQTKRNQRTTVAAMRRYAEAAIKLHEGMASLEGWVSSAGPNLQFEKLSDHQKLSTLLTTLERAEAYMISVQNRNDAAVAAMKQGTRTTPGGAR